MSPRRSPRLHARLLSLLVLLGATLFASPAFAQTQKNLMGPSEAGVDTHLFRPAIDSKGFFSVNGADLLGHLDFSLGLILDYGYDIMPTNPGHGAEQLLEHSFQGTVQFDIGLANWIVLGISAPVVLAGVDALNDIGPQGATYSTPSLFAQGLSFVALHAKLRLIRPSTGPTVGLALIAQGGIEANGSENLIAEPGGFVWPQLAFEARVGRQGEWRLGLNGGFRAHFGDNGEFSADTLEHGNFEYGQLVTAGFGTSLRVLEPLDLVAETYMTYLVTGDSDAEQRPSAEAIGGIKLFIDGKSHLMLGGGAGYLPGFQTATARATLGFVFEPSIGDRDGDGIKDDEDDCPDQPEDPDGFEDTREDSPPGQYGCPDPDNDKDGILDVDDACPNNPEDKDGDEDEDGCPEVRDGDRDKDGILDSKDKCPDEPETFNGYEDSDGCPDTPPEQPTAKDDTVILTDDSIIILDKIQFATGSAKILEESFRVVDAVVKVMKEHPELALIEVQGHADERAADAYNLKLTKDRAKAVNDAMVQRGVEQKRLRAMGYGEYCPIDAASTPEAWEKNRRVEFKIVRTADGPTGVELGCAAAEAKGVKALPP